MKYFDRNTWFWIFVAAVFFLPFLGGVHLFDWDEINFAELAREMTVTGDYLRMQINYETFTEKPPFFFWLQAGSMNIFGIGEYAARFPNALLGILVLPFLYVGGKFLIDRKFGFIWAMSWFGSILPFLYFKSGIIDPFFNFFIFSAIFFLIHFIWRRRKYDQLYFSRKAISYLWMAGIAVGLGVLTKGPVAYLIVFLCLLVYFIKERFNWYIPPASFFGFSFLGLGVFLLWFGVDAVINGPDFLVEFTIRQWELLTTNDAGHGGFAGYHFVVLLFGCFPASIFAIRGMGKFDGLAVHLQDFKVWMTILLWVILILFSLVGTKIIHYSSLAYYPISFLSALTIWRYVEEKKKFPIWISISLIFIGLIIVLVSFALPYAAQNIEMIKPLFVNDPFAMANLDAEVNWSSVDYIPAIWMLLVLVIAFVVLRSSRLHFSRVIFFGTGIWVFLALISFIGKVESISQNASVEFFENQVGKEVYVTTYDYKSYVPWFYARVQPYSGGQPNDNSWLLKGDTDRPVMISCKITSHEKLEKELPDAEFLYAKNGFYFYRRN